MVQSKLMERWCDLVLEGGGVKGLGLVGAYTQIANAGYKIHRVAGTSAGAIVGSLIAAGMPVDSMLAILKSVDYKKFRDESFIDKLGTGGKAASLLLEQGIYEGKYLQGWLGTELDKLGVRTFADLKLDEPWAEKLPPERRYKLVVVASDITSGKLAYLPWDYKRYGLDPDEQPVVEAVRASMSIPFFYEPVKLNGQLLVDGGMLSNFPIGLFDETPNWPTFGLKLSAKSDSNLVANPVNSTLDFAKALLATMINAHDQIHIDDPCTQERTIFVDTFKIKATNFDINPEEQQKLFDSGQKSAREFLKNWDFSRWHATCG